MMSTGLFSTPPMFSRPRCVPTQSATATQPRCPSFHNCSRRRLLQRFPQFTRHAVDREQVLADVRTVVAEQLGREFGKVKPEHRFADLGADSLDTVEIMMELESKFDLQLDEEGSERVATIKDAADLISNQIEAL